MKILGTMVTWHPGFVEAFKMEKEMDVNWYSNLPFP
jgi:hypothetical protein